MAGRIDRMPLHGAARPWRGQLLHARARVVGEEEEWGRGADRIRRRRSDVCARL